MTLTKTERLILRNQFRILAKLDKDEAKSYERYAKAFERGFTLSYEELFDDLGEELSPEDCRLVWDVLGMYDGMRSSWARLPADKGGIEKSQIQYQGFGGNTETLHMAYSRYIVQDCGRFKDLDIYRDHNAHRPMIAGYCRMLDKWQEFGRSHDMHAEQLKAVISAS